MAESLEIALIGSDGKFGQALVGQINNCEEISCEGLISEEDETRRIAEGRVLSAIRESRSQIFIVALGLEGHTSDIGKKIYQAIFERQEFTAAININSIQAYVHQEIAQLLDSPNHMENSLFLSAHTNYANGELDPEKGGPLYDLVTQSSSTEDIQKVEDIVCEVSRSVSGSLKNRERHHFVDLRNEQYTFHGNEYSGAELHDYLLAVYQCFPQMVRLCFEDEEFFEWLRKKIQVTRDFAWTLIKNNKYAQQIFTQFFEEKSFGSIDEAVCQLPYIIAYMGIGDVDKKLQEEIQTLNYKTIVQKIEADVYTTP